MRKKVSVQILKYRFKPNNLNDVCNFKQENGCDKMQWNIQITTENQYIYIWLTVLDVANFRDRLNNNVVKTYLVI